MEAAVAGSGEQESRRRRMRWSRGRSVGRPGSGSNQPAPTFLTGHPARESPARGSGQELARGRTRRPPPVGPALHPRVSLLWPGDFPPPPPQ